MDGDPPAKDPRPGTHQRSRCAAPAQVELARVEVTGTAGGGLVSVTLRGTGEVARVVIDPVAIDQCDAESLSALVFTAMARATENARSLTDR